jgi:hypothetical protein
MNATTDLLYPTLVNLPRTFNSKDYRRKIERLSLEELDKHIEGITNSSFGDDINRHEKLRLCLRFRNAHLINLPYFEVTKINERHIFTGQIEKDIVVLYFLNFRNSHDMEAFKANTANIAKNKEIIGILIMKENSFGFEEMREYSKQFCQITNFIFEIESSQYNHLVSRNRLQDILFKYCIDAPIIPCISFREIIMALHKGRNFTASRYPENKNDLDFDLFTTVNLLLQKMNFLDSENLVVLIMIEFNPDIDNQFMYDLRRGNQDWQLFNDLFYRMVYKGGAEFVIMVNDKIDSRMRVSIIATDSIQTGKSQIEIERDKAFARLKKRLAENQRS